MPLPDNRRAGSKAREDQIERKVERFVDQADRMFMDGKIDQRSYDRLMRDIDKWAERQSNIATAVRLKLGEPAQS
jgi:hypothetical protein